MWFWTPGSHSVCPTLTSDAWRNSGKNTLWKIKFKCIRKEEGKPIQHLCVLSEKGWKDAIMVDFCVFQVFGDYVDDCKNTDNAWVEIIVLNIHLDRATQVLVDVNNVVRTWTFTQRDRRSAVMQRDCYVIVFLIGHEQLWLSWVAGGELQNKTQLKPTTLPALGGQAAQQQVLILPRFIPSHWKHLINPAAAEMSKLTRLMLSQHVYTDPTVVVTHTCSNTGIFQIQRVLLSCAKSDNRFPCYLKKLHACKNEPQI